MADDSSPNAPTPPTPPNPPNRRVARLLTWCVRTTLPFPALDPRPASTEVVGDHGIGSGETRATLQRIAAAIALVASVTGGARGKTGEQSLKSTRGVKAAAWSLAVIAAVVWIGLHTDHEGVRAMLVSPVRVLSMVVSRGTIRALNDLILPFEFPDRKSFAWMSSTSMETVWIGVNTLVGIAVLLWFFRLFIAFCLRLRLGNQPCTGAETRTPRQRRTDGAWQTAMMLFTAYFIHAGVTIIVYGPIADLCAISYGVWIAPSNGMWYIASFMDNGFASLHSTAFTLVASVLTAAGIGTVFSFLLREPLAHRITARDLSRNCSGCGYTLTGITTNANNQGVCPECGEPFVRNA